MTGYTGGIGGLPPQPPLDCDAPTPPPEDIVPVINSVIGTGEDGRFVVFGEHFINNDFGVIDSIEVVTDGGTFTFYSTTGPNAGSNPPGTSDFTLPDVPDTDSGISVVAEALYGLTITQITVRNQNGDYAVVHDVNPPVFIPGTTGPVVYGIGVSWVRADGGNVDAACDNSTDPGRAIHLGLNVAGEQLDTGGGVRFIHSTGQFDLMFNDPQGGEWREISAGYITYVAPQPHPYGGLRMTNAILLDGAGDPISDPGAAQALDIYDVATVGITPDDHWRIEFASPPPTIPGFLNIVACQDYDGGSAGQGVGGYDPNGPNAGANAGQGTVVHQWDADAIEIENVGSPARALDRWVLVTVMGNDGDQGHVSARPDWVALP